MNKSCIWCGSELNEHTTYCKKPYCKTCNKKCVRECRRCHRPFPHIRYFYNANDIRCKACQNKYCKEKLKRAQKKQMSRRGSASTSK